MFEKINSTHKPSLAETFSNLTVPETTVTPEDAFTALEKTLWDNGFSIASAIEAREIFSEQLYCRSEQFSKVITLLEGDESIEIINEDAHANMCTMSGGSGFKIAMTEGFSGKDVAGTIKVVVTFTGEHLTAHGSVPKEDELWATKPDTAAVSLVGKGGITKEDVRMISFRIPVRFFPETELSDEEKDLLEEDKIQFIVRHYVAHEKTALT